MLIVSIRSALMSEPRELSPAIRAATLMATGLSLFWLVVVGMLAHEARTRFDSHGFAQAALMIVGAVLVVFQAVAAVLTLVAGSRRSALIQCFILALTLITACIGLQ